MLARTMRQTRVVSDRRGTDSNSLATNAVEPGGDVVVRLDWKTPGVIGRSEEYVLPVT
jgi:hypothetical protein